VDEFAMHATADKAKLIFLAAAEIADAGQRKAYLDAECAGDANLRCEVDDLLHHFRCVGSFMESPALDRIVPLDASSSPERPGTIIGPYKLLEQIGEGGMGLVFMAEQTHPVRRKVALKVLKPGMETRQVVARFEAERQALAMMDHPHIAKIFDAGVTGTVASDQWLVAREEKSESASLATSHSPLATTGRPYFVMELVRGVPITEYCDERRLTTRQRLELFVTVCQAVQHAHQKGVIHRDLKPSNVLVSHHDTVAVPKIIDFGIAKATGSAVGGLTERTLFTNFTLMLGTPLYMSPEQAEMNGLDVDTRSDVYSLGVMLYELLTGTTPFASDSLKKVGPDEMRRIIREEEPPPPSRRLSTRSVQACSTVSERRGADGRRLGQVLRGELDWIVMKALEKDRDRRYESASAFAADVQRYLNDEAVEACPPSKWYRIRKVARRHRQALAAACLILLFIVSLGAGVGWVVRDQAARRAESARVITAALDESASWQEQRRLPEALSAARWADGLLAGADGDEALAQQVRRRLADLELLDRLENVRLEQATAVKDGRFDVAAADAEYARILGEAGLNVVTLSEDEAGDRIRGSTVATELAATLDLWAMLRKRNGGADDESWKQMLRVARLADPDAERARLREALELRNPQALRNLAASQDVLHLPIATLSLLGFLLLEDKEVSNQAETFLREVQRQYPNDFWANHNLAQFYYLNVQPPRLDEAIRFSTAAVVLRPLSPGARVNLGLVLKDKGRLDEAIAEYRAAIQLKVDYVEARYLVGNALGQKGQLDQAIAECREAVRLKNDDPVAHLNLGVAFYRNNQLDEAIGEWHEALRLRRDYADAHYNLGNALCDRGRQDQAITEYHEAIRLNKNFAESHCNLGHILRDKGEFREALSHLRQGHQLGSPNPRWPYPSARWVEQCERLLAFDEKLPAIQNGQQLPASVAEYIGLAELCRHASKRRYAAAARWYAKAFAAQPPPSDGPVDERYNAARAAALAGCGQGNDGDQADDNERPRLRRQALDWLRTDLAACRQLLEKEPIKAPPMLAQRLQNWQLEKEFAGVRGEALKHLPEAEREEWQKLWADVADLVTRPQTNRGPENNLDRN
jgi:serine/threonine protein kinase/tetratricopeptide (TPR) repeat protein